MLHTFVIFSLFVFVHKLSEAKDLYPYFLLLIWRDLTPNFSLLFPLSSIWVVYMR